MKPVNCRCGGESYVYKCEADIERPWSVMCKACEIITKQYSTEEGAVSAWNLVMGGVAKVLNQARISRYSFGECGACGAPVIKPDKYCSECGAKLDWGDDE